MADNQNAGSSIGAKLFVAFLVVATAALSVLVVLLSNENKALSRALEKYEAAVKSKGLTVGDIVGDVQLIDAEARPFSLEFGEGRPYTLFLLTSAGCDGCELTLPVWESVLTEVQPQGLRIVNVCAGVTTPQELHEQAQPMWTSYLAPAGHEGWIRQIPLAPATLLIRPDGSILQRWYGPISEGQAAQLRTALIDVAGD